MAVLNTEKANKKRDVLIGKMTWQNFPQTLRTVCGIFVFSAEEGKKKRLPCVKGTQRVEKAKVISNLRKSFRPPFLKGGAVKGA
ncbi:MAG: hypothetical protein ACI3XR_01360, partial [Eubacteriales bacterium]